MIPTVEVIVVIFILLNWENGALEKGCRPGSATSKLRSLKQILSTFLSIGFLSS
jgi:hypothetical protein